MLQGTYKMRIAVCFNRQKLIIDCDDFHQRSEWLDWIDCEDNDVRGIPDEKGVYDCTVEHHVVGGGEDVDWHFQVVSYEKVL